MSRGSAEAGAIGALSARWSAGPVLVRTPATSANLGPGFDALGLALRLHDEGRAEVTGGGLRSEASGAGQVGAPVDCGRAERPAERCVRVVPRAAEAAGRVLTRALPHADAAKTAARCALLVAALTQPGLVPDAGLLLDATEDFLHQRYRAGSMPATAELVRELREAGVPAVVSGAGPAALAFVLPGVT